MTSPTHQLLPAPRRVRRAIVKHSFCTLATSSGDAPHSVGVLYAAVDGALYVSTLEASKKARNIRENPRVAVCIPVRRYPMAPPFLVQLAATAEVLPARDPGVVELLRAHRLRKITSHGSSTTPVRAFSGSPRTARSAPTASAFRCGACCGTRSTGAARSISVLRDMPAAHRAEYFDVVIVGARGAGASLATHLARAGVSVAVVDAAPLSSGQPASTHLIQPPGMDELDVLGIGERVRDIGAALHEQRARREVSCGRAWRRVAFPRS